MSEISESEIKSMTKEQNYMRGYEDGKSDVLDKIRPEIDRYLFQNEFGSEYRKEISQIIDKYKAEGSDKE